MRGLASGEVDGARARAAAASRRAETETAGLGQAQERAPDPEGGVLIPTAAAGWRLRTAAASRLAPVKVYAAPVLSHSDCDENGEM